MFKNVFANRITSCTGNLPVAGCNGVQFKLPLKGDERGFMSTAKNKLFYSKLILLLSVTSIRRKLLKRLIPKNIASIQIHKVAIFKSDHKIINLIPSKSFKILQTVVIDYLSTHSYIVDIS